MSYFTAVRPTVLNILGFIYITGNMPGKGKSDKMNILGTYFIDLLLFLVLFNSQFHIICDVQHKNVLNYY